MPNASDSLGSIFRRVYRLLEAPERKRGILLLVLILVNSVVDIFGLAVVIPVIGLVADPALIERSGLLNRLYAATGFSSHEPFIILLSVVMFGAALFKAVFGILVVYVQTRFSFAVAHRLSGTMWDALFGSSLEQMRSTSSGRVISKINVWPVGFANIYLVSMVALMTEFFVVLFVAVGLVLYNPLVFVLVVIIISTGSILLRVYTRARLASYSAIVRELEPHSNTAVTGAIRGFLEIVTFGAVSSVRNYYLRLTERIYRIRSNLSVLSQAPIKLYESLAVLSITVAIILSLTLNFSEELFTTLSLLAIAAYRVMPAVSRFSGALLKIRGSAHLLEAMEDGVETAVSQANAPTSAPSDKITRVEIDLDDLTLGYKALREPVISALSARFKPGSLYAIVGPSGSGKSTLISALLGLHQPLEGNIAMRRDGGGQRRLYADLGQLEWLAHTAYLAQHPFLFEGTVRENLTLRIPSFRLDVDLVNDLVDRLELRSSLGSDPLQFVLQEGGSNLSGGQQQRLALLRALQVERPVLILDEATSALDERMRDIVFALLRERADAGATVILVTHDMDIAAQCDERLNLTVRTIVGNDEQTS